MREEWTDADREADAASAARMSALARYIAAGPEDDDGGEDDDDVPGVLG